MLRNCVGKIKVDGYQIVNIPLYFRAMTPTVSGLPSVGPSKRMLGALPSETNSPDGTFGPGTGGMSIAPDSPWHIPHHRRPREMGKGSTGPAQDWVFVIQNNELNSVELTARLDPRNPVRHAFVEPLVTVSFTAYSSTLANTQNFWRRL